MREALVKVKQPTLELDKKGVIYEVPCGECDHVYIGETGRTLRKRLTKHKAAVKKQDQKNGIAVHAWKSGHQVEWESAKVKEVVPNLSHAQKDRRSSPHPPDSKHNKPGFWTNFRQCLVPPPHMIPPPPPSPIFHFP